MFQHVPRAPGGILRGQVRRVTPTNSGLAVMGGEISVEGYLNDLRGSLGRDPERA